MRLTKTGSTIPLNLFYVKIHVKLPQVFTILHEIHVMYAVQNFIFDVKIHVTIARLFIILREFSSKVPASVHYFT